MILSLRRLVYIFAVLLETALLVSCGGGGGGGTSAGTGTLNLSLTDAPNANYKAVYVTINEIWVKHSDKDWEMLNSPDLKLPQTLNLREFVNGARAQLGIIELEAGHYNQMRLMLGTKPVGEQHDYPNYLILKDDDKQIPLKVPSGYQTGIKLVKGFDIEDSKATEIILDFDANKSVHAHPAGNTGEWRLRPTIKVVEINNSVSGKVVQIVSDAEEALPDAQVNAQIYDNSQLMGSPDEVESVAGVFSDMDGTYFMFLPINTSASPYNIVATKTVYDHEIVVYEPKCHILASTTSSEYLDVDFTLSPAKKSGRLLGSITGLPVPGAGVDYSVNLSIRQFADCDSNEGPETMIEVVYRSFPNSAGEDIVEYGPIILPEGEYELVAWADGAEAIYPPFDIMITDGADITQNIDFGTP